MVGLCCCERAFSSCDKWGLLFLAVCGLLIAVASLVAEHSLLGTQALVVVVCELSSCSLWTLWHWLSNCGTWAYLLCGMWDLPGSGIKPVSLALQGSFLTTAPPGKPLSCYFQ